MLVGVFFSRVSALGLGRAASVVALACEVSGCVADAPERALATRAAPIIAGAPDTTSRSAVALVQNVGPCGAPSLEIFCSGVLVAPRVVLTAAHCLEDVPTTAIEIFFGPSILGSGTRVPVLEGHVHPRYEKDSHAFDVAALVLASDPPPDHAPTALRTMPLTPAMVGAVVRVIGFGVEHKKAIVAGVRRSGSAVVTDVTDAELRIRPGPAMTCQGDSGGPVMLATATGEEVIGITSWGDLPCVEFGAAVRVDRILEPFLSSVVARANVPLKQPPFSADAPFCTASCATHADCPMGTTCTASADGPLRCTFRGLDGYRLGKPCAHPDDCEEACLDTPVGCRCTARCDAVGPATSEAPVPPTRVGGGGCGVPRDPTTTLAAPFAALLLAASIARGRRRTGSRRGSGRCNLE